MLLCRGGNHRFILRCIVWLSRGKTRLEARPTRTDSGAARTGGWTFHRIAPALGGCGNFDGRMEAVVFVDGGGERGDDLPHRRCCWVAAAALGMLCTHCDWMSRLSLGPLA